MFPHFLFSPAVFLSLVMLWRFLFYLFSFCTPAAVIFFVFFSQNVQCHNFFQCALKALLCLCISSVNVCLFLFDNHKIYPQIYHKQMMKVSFSTDTYLVYKKAMKHFQHYCPGIQIQLIEHDHILLQHET